MRHWLYKYGHHILAHAHEILVALVMEASHVSVGTFLLLFGVLALVAGVQVLLGAVE